MKRNEVIMALALIGYTQKNKNIYICKDRPAIRILRSSSIANEWIWVGSDFYTLKDFLDFFELYAEPKRKSNNGNSMGRAFS